MHPGRGLVPGVFPPLTQHHPDPAADGPAMAAEQGRDSLPRGGRTGEARQVEQLGRGRRIRWTGCQSRRRLTTGSGRPGGSALRFARGSAAYAMRAQAPRSRTTAWRRRRGRGPTRRPAPQRLAAAIGQVGDLAGQVRRQAVEAPAEPIQPAVDPFSRRRWLRRVCSAMIRSCRDGADEVEVLSISESAAIVSGAVGKGSPRYSTSNRARSRSEPMKAGLRIRWIFRTRPSRCRAGPRDPGRRGGGGPRGRPCRPPGRPRRRLRAAAATMNGKNTIRPRDR